MIKLMMTLAVVATMSAQAGTIHSRNPRNLIVYTTGGSLVPAMDLYSAKSGAAKILATVGISVEWRTGAPANSQLEQEGALAVRFTDKTSADFKLGVMAFALPAEGYHITVMYDRLSLFNNEPRSRPAVLAHVLVHEITHILQGVSRHSETGIMKAHWTTHDLIEMQVAPLPFTAIDIQLLQQGLDRRLSSLMATAK